MAELAALQQSAAVASLDGKRLRHVPQTRQILRKLIVGRLTCEAFEEGGQRGYRFTGQGTYEHLLPGKLVPTMVVTPAGFDSITSWATLPFEALALAP